MVASPGVDEPAILRARDALRHFDFQRHPAPTALAASVDHFWTVVWDLPAGETYAAQTLPHAAVNLSVTNTEADVTGIQHRRYERPLHGAGYAVGVRFRPACFRPWLGRSVSFLSDTHRPIEEVLGRPTRSLARAVARAGLDRRVQLLADFLSAGVPPPDPTAQRLAEAVETVAATPTVTRVGQLAELARTSVRTLQRDFAEYVGASPKWVIQRCRLHDVAARAASAGPISWAAVATELGFADQAHLVRAFTAAVGVPPATYARRDG